MKKVIAILSLCLALAMTSLSCGSGADEAKIDAEMGVSALAALADSHIKGYIDSMEALAMTQEVQSAHWQSMKELLQKVDEAGTGGTVWFVLPDGSYYTVEQGLTDQDLSDRDYFEELMDGSGVLGSLVESKSTGKKSLIAAVPVKRGGDVVGAVGSSIFLDELSITLASEIDLPNDMIFWAVNQDGEIALHSDTGMILEQADGLPESVASETSPLTGWAFALAFKD
jgi:Cache domain